VNVTVSSSEEARLVGSGGTLDSGEEHTGEKFYCIDTTISMAPFSLHVLNS
jgi:hypothetical protein